MDLLRSCYSTTMNFGGIECPVQWYFVGDDTPVFPLPNRFNSKNWAGDRLGPDDTLGEVYGAPRPWRNGRKLGNAAGSGHYCGTEDQWLNGVTDHEPPVGRNAFGTPVCCDTEEPPFKHFQCVNCPNGSWSDYVLSVAGMGGTPSLARLNGTWRLRYIGSCTWESVPIALLGGLDPVTWRAVHDPADEWTVFSSRPFGAAYVVYKLRPAVDCMLARLVPFDSKFFAGSVAPARVSLRGGLPDMPPIGSIIIWAGPIVPAGYLICDGSTVARGQFPELFAAIGTTWGAGDGVNTFRIPSPPLTGIVAGARWIIAATPPGV